MLTDTDEKTLPCRYRLNRKIDILGSEWTIQILTPEEDPRLNTSGYVDRSGRLIVVQDVAADCTLEKPEKILFEVIRHEIIHAFMFESGLGDNVEHRDLGQEETWVDWFAIQFHKIEKAVTSAYSGVTRCVKCFDSCEGCYPNYGKDGGR